MSEAAALPGTEQESFNPHRKGMNYHTFLSQVGEVLRPRTYFEIGTQRGLSLARFNCACVAVDPVFQPTLDIIGKKRSLMLFQMTSDDFFADYKLSSLYPGGLATIDVAFLDGMHHFEFLLRDFMNTEKASRLDSIVMMHDTFPTVPRAALRRHERRAWAQTTSRPVMKVGGGWTGDVWKVVDILRRYRPDLTIMNLNAPPTGLSLITGLDPSSTVLADRYDDIVRDWMDAELKEGWFDRYYDATEFTASNELGRPESLLERFKPFVADGT